jgi:hypothetical protein
MTCEATKMKRSFFLSWGAPFVGAILAFLVAFGLWPRLSDTLWPVEDWYELVSVEVGDAVQGTPIPLRAVRIIHRPFDGSYITTIREVGKSQPICNGGMAVPYKVGDDTILERDIEYWTEGAKPPCMDSLYPGNFILTTCVVVNTRHPLDHVKMACADSNVFTIHPRDIAASR